MSDLIRRQFEGHDVRLATHRDGAVWWVAADVCAALGIRNASDAVSRLRDDEKDTIGFTDSVGRPHQLLIVSEPGLYRLIFRSNKTEALRFQDWVFHEVLPTIRKTGSYTTPPAAAAGGNLDVLARVSVQLADVVTDHEHRLAELERHVSEVRALPAPVARPRADLRLVRGRFAGALRAAIAASGVTARMTAAESAAYHQGVNSTLKSHVMCGRGRANWQLEHYERAVDYLRVKHGLDLRWIFGVDGEEVA